MAKSHASGAADITVASLQSLISGDRLEKYNPDDFKLVLVDEAHHAVAPGYLKTLAHFGLDTTKPESPALVGVSATFSRFDGLKLGAVFDRIVYHKDMVDMIADNWLAGLIFSTVKSHVDLRGVKSNAQGDFQVTALSQAVNTQPTNEITVQAWLAKAKERKSTLVFCVDIKHLMGLTTTFRNYGIDARFVTGETKKQSRSEILDAFKAGEFPVLLNCGVFTEGTDIPNIDCVLLARPTRSRNLLIQMIGRGARLHPGKEDCHVIDMVSTLDTSIVTAPTLFGLDPYEILENANLDKVNEIKQERDAGIKAEEDNRFGPPVIPVSTSLSFIDYDSVHDLIDDSSGERHIRALSQNAWVQVSPDRFVLETATGKLTIQCFNLDERDRMKSQTEQMESEDPNFIVEFAEAIPNMFRTKGAPFRRTREITKAWLFTDAVHAADSFAAAKFERIFIVKNAPWRGKPASDSQLAYLVKMGVIEEDALESAAQQFTKGKAADMIVKLKYGARGRFEKIKAVKKKVLKNQEKIEKRTLRESVSVGPLGS